MATASFDPRMLAVLVAATVALLSPLTTTAFRAGKLLSSPWFLTPAPALVRSNRREWCIHQHRPSTDTAALSLFRKPPLDTADPLIPESNPHAQPDQRSVSGVRYGSVLHGLQVLYPPETLDERNALSRRDGYWPFVQRGDEPPTPLTYGEFDFYFLAQLLDRAVQYVDPEEGLPNGWNGKTFCDLGSGTGRLVLAAAALHPGWKLCRGIELLPLISTEANRALKQCRRLEDGPADPEGKDDTDTFGYMLPQSQLPLAPVEFSCGSFEDPYIYFGDADLVFVFASCMGADQMKALAVALGRQCRPGALIITTDYMLPLEGEIPPVENPTDERIPTGHYKLKLLERVEGWCWLTGGPSTAFIHRLEQSLSVGPLERPVLSLQEQALQIVRAYEAKTLTDTPAFLRNVYNNIIFNGLPERFLPKLNRD